MQHQTGGDALRDYVNIDDLGLTSDDEAGHTPSPPDATSAGMGGAPLSSSQATELFGHLAEPQQEVPDEPDTPRPRRKPKRDQSIRPKKGQQFIEKSVDAATWKRLRAAQKSISHVNNKILKYGSGNQVNDIEKSGGVAQVRAMETVNKQSDKHYVEKSAQDPDPGRVAAQQSILANHYHAGVCDTYSYATFNHLRQVAKGETITRAGADCGDHGGHAFNIIGDMAKDDPSKLVVADPWATSPQPVLYEDFFLGGQDTDHIRSKDSMVADGKNGTKKYKNTVSFDKDKGSAKQIAHDPTALDAVPDKIKEEQYQNDSVLAPRYKAPIFYYNENWSDRKRNKMRKRFAKDLDSNKHLGPKAMKDLGLDKKGKPQPQPTDSTDGD